MLFLKASIIAFINQSGLMHACAWIIVPLVRAEADGNST